MSVARLPLILEAAKESGATEARDLLREVRVALGGEIARSCREGKGVLRAVHLPRELCSDLAAAAGRIESGDAEAAEPFVARLRAQEWPSVIRTRPEARRAAFLCFLRAFPEARYTVIPELELPPGIQVEEARPSG